MIVRDDGGGSAWSVILCRKTTPRHSQHRRASHQPAAGYMLPSAIVWMDRFPRQTASRREGAACPTRYDSCAFSFLLYVVYSFVFLRVSLGSHFSYCVGVEAREGYVAPRTPTEEAVAEIFSELLRVPKISLRDSFFDIGGHSLLAAQLISRLQKMFKIELPLSAVFESPSVAGMSMLVDSLRKQSSAQAADSGSDEKLRRRLMISLTRC